MLKVINVKTGEIEMIHSIFGKRLEILKDNEDDMKVVVRCPNCGQATLYGQMRMCSGYSGCDNKVKIKGKEVECYFGDLMPRVVEAHEHNYEEYRNGKFYRYADGLGGIEE